MREASVVADLKKDYFLLCKKEHLARTDSANKGTRDLQTTSGCRVPTRVISPTSPCQWSVGFSRLRQLDSVFDGDGALAPLSSTDDEAKQVSREGPKSTMAVS